jgi:hypothetical protein
VFAELIFDLIDILKSIFFWDMTPCSALSGTRRHIPEEDTLQNHRCENLKSYIIDILLQFVYYDVGTTSRIVPSLRLAMLVPVDQDGRPAFIADGSNILHFIFGYR